MTLVLGCLGVVLALLLAGFTRDLAHASAARARAQLAADAAALAAVAESGPYGSGDPEAEARRYAELNGARLTDCLCTPGATAVQVTVVADGVVARARAVFDPAALVPAELFGDHGVHPLLRAAVERLVAASSGAVRVVSGYRSQERQRELWQAAIDRYGSAEAADDWVARPGTSMHERGLAVDLAGDVELAVSLIDRLGLPLHRPLPHEPWHFELRASRQ